MSESKGPSEKDINFKADEEPDDLTPREKYEDKIDEAIEARRLEIKATLEEPQSEHENLSEKEKNKRARFIAIDLISTSREPALKAQSEEARSKFVTEVITQFDSRGWTIPKNYFLVYGDEATDLNKAKKSLLNAIAAEAKSGTDII